MIQKIESIANHYGLASQLDKTIEEVAELRIAIHQYEENPQKHKGDLIDEIADVSIMCQQLACLVDKVAVCERVKFKVVRQLKRIESKREQIRLCK